MLMSSTFSTSAPKSASSSEQNPPGNRRERSSTRMPCSAPLTRSPPHALAHQSATHQRPPGRPSKTDTSRLAPHALRDGQHLARLLHCRRPPPDVFGHLPRLRDQL